MLKRALLVAFAATTLMPVGVGKADVEANLPAYQAVSGIAGNLKSIGSDSLNNLMTLWAEGFQHVYPNVKIEIEGKGSSTAPPALVAGTAQFGPMSRPMKEKEIDEFKAKFGYAPSAVHVAVDALAVFVHKDNPIPCLSLQQLDAMFSKTRRSNYASEILTWGDAGLTGAWAKVPISLYGRNSASGTYGYFKEVALFAGDYRDTVKEQPGSSAVVQGVASEKSGIGYSGIGYKTADVRAVSIAAETGGACVMPSEETAYSGDYPITRYLYLYMNKSPNEALDPLRAEFVRFVLSHEGQDGTVKDGYFPVLADVAKENLSGLGLSFSGM